MTGEKGIKKNILKTPGMDYRGVLLFTFPSLV